MTSRTKIKIQYRCRSIDAPSALSKALSYLGNDLHGARAQAAQDNQALSPQLKDSCNFHNPGRQDKLARLRYLLR
jgi:hypothetical protein